MVRISYKHSTSEFYIELEGHAEYAAGGKDIVCAAVSTIVGVLKMAYDDALCKNEIKKIEDTFSPGHVKMYFHYRAVGSRMRYIADVCIRALHGIAEQYPENIKIEHRADA